MKSRICILTLLLAVIALGANAQNDLWLLKNGKTVKKITLNEGDYITFRKPASVPGAEALALKLGSVGKNYVGYHIDAPASKRYYHALVPRSAVESTLAYLGGTIDEADPETIRGVLQMTMSSYAMLGTGSADVTLKNGANVNGTTLFVLPGQQYYLALLGLDAQGSADTEVIYDTLSTLKPSKSAETLSASYRGLTSQNVATFGIVPSTGIATFQTVFGPQTELEMLLADKGITELMKSNGSSFTPDSWQLLPDSLKGWKVSDADDYMLLLLGVDNQGDTVSARCTAHIEGQGLSTAPKITVGEHSAKNGNVNVVFVTKKDGVQAARVRLMKDNDVFMAINNGKSLKDLVEAPEAEDVTTQVQSAGTYTFSRTGLEHDWYSLLFSVTNAEGTTVVRAVFNSDLDGAEWSITQNKF